MTDQTARRAISSGWAFYDAGNMPLALREFKSALATEPENREALTGLAQTQVTTGDTLTALATVDSLLRIAPESASAHRLKADALRRRKRKREALQSAREGVRLAPRDPIGHHILGVVLTDMRKFSEALKTVREGRELAPNDANLMAQEAWLVFETKGGKAAAPLIEEALRSGLDSDYVLVLAANIAVARNELERARELITPVLQRNANDEEALSIYLLTDRTRYGLLRAHHQFPYWRKENGVIGWIGWLSFWTLLILFALVIVVATRVSGLIIGLAFRWFLHAQYAAHRKDVRKHFQQQKLSKAF